MLRILIVDDHPIVREGLKQIVSETSDMRVVAEAANATEALKQIRQKDCDVILLDISMPGRNGLDILEDLKKFERKPRVLVLSIHPEEQYAIRAFRAGASGYLTKESAPIELIDAIRKVSRGGKYISPSVAEQLALNLDGDDRRPLHHCLSNREYYVMCMIASGKTINEIARDLVLSKKTIVTYRSRLMHKMRMNNTAEITRYAIQNQLID